MTEFLQRRQARIRDRIKETLEEVKKQQQAEQETDELNETESSITLTKAITTTEVPVEPAQITTIDDEEDIMVIDWARDDHQIQLIVGSIGSSISVSVSYSCTSYLKGTNEIWMNDASKNWSHEFFECKQISSSSAWSCSMRA